MNAAVLDQPRRRSQKAAPTLTGFWEKVKSLNAEAKQVQRLPSSRMWLLVSSKGAKAPVQQAALVKEMSELEHRIHELRKLLEKTAKSPAANDSAPNSMELMVAKGELLDPAAFADQLGWSRQALSKALGANRVFFVEHAGARYYPAFYADTRYERRHLEAVSKLLGELPGGAKLQFFMNSRGSLNKATPLQALARGQVAAVKSAAEGFAQG